jgi:phage terminase Nu1 subunit (DNA packaging protein)
MEPISREKLASLLDVTSRTVKRRLTEALIEPIKTEGRVDYYDSGIAIRAILAPDTAADGLDLQQERAALAKAQREHYELRNAEALSKLTPNDIVTQVVDREYGAVRGRLRAIPAAAAPEAAHQDERHVQTILERHVDEALHELRGAGIPRAGAENADGSAQDSA